jgi:hypothetical protein
MHGVCSSSSSSSSSAKACVVSLCCSYWCTVFNRVQLMLLMYCTVETTGFTATGVHINRLGANNGVP